MDEVDIQQLSEEAHEALARSSTAEDLEAWRVAYMGRKGKVPLLLRGMKDVAPKERSVLGSKANQLRAALEEAYAAAKDTMQGKSSEVAADLLWQQGSIGHLHPLTLAIRRIQQVLAALGFQLVEGPEIELIRYAFDDLNMPLEHPARAETDTFYIQSHPDLVLRQHTSSVQVRSVIELDLTPPLAVASVGRVYRSERTDATHETTFHQFEGLAVGQDISLRDLKSTLATLYSTYFGSDVSIRLRPSYFPFVEPGLEVDISCVFCESGCRVCKYTKWIEVMGAGMVHPNVLRNMNIDPGKYRGFAFGGAIDRLVMIQHAIPDIRMFWSGDIRFLKQFS